LGSGSPGRSGTTIDRKKGRSKVVIIFFRLENQLRVQVTRTATFETRRVEERWSRSTSDRVELTAAGKKVMKKTTGALALFLTLISNFAGISTPRPFEARVSDFGPGDASARDPRSAKLPGDLLAIIDSKDRGRSEEDGPVLMDVIVQTDDVACKADFDAIERIGGQVTHRFESINALLVRIPSSAIEKLACVTGVDFITPDRELESAMDATTQLVGADQIRELAESSYGNTYPGVDGTGIGIAFLDSGTSSAYQDDFRAEVKSRIVHFKDFTGDSTGISRRLPYDDFGHGTTVAGVAAGSGWGSRQRSLLGTEWYPGNYGDFSGIAPNANVISLKVIDYKGAGTLSSAIRALDYCISVRYTYNIRVINISLGAPIWQSYKVDPLCQAVERCVENGIVVVCSAGNFGHNDVITGYDGAGKPIYQTVYGGISSPANDPKVITVGATKNTSQTTLIWPNRYSPPYINPNPAPLRRSDVQVASFSSRGPTLVDGIVKPDLVAPGTKVVAAATRDIATLTHKVLPGTVVPPTGEGALQSLYCQLTGTSFAAPVVSGVVALMLDANPSLTPGQVKGILRLSAQTLPSLAHKNQVEKLLTQGAGLVNCYAAVRLAQNLRSDANLAAPGDTLLRPGVTLEGLSEDLKLSLIDREGNVLEYARLDSGLLMSEGIVLTDGFLLTEGIVLTDSLIGSESQVITDGFLLTEGFLLTDGSVWPDGFLLTDSYVEQYCLTSAGGRLAVVPDSLVHAVKTNTFYADGVFAESGKAGGNISFSSQGVGVWSGAVLDPRSMPPGASVENATVMGSNDDVSIIGVGFVTKSSPYYPRK
jgi:serine protease AprX